MVKVSVQNLHYFKTLAQNSSEKLEMCRLQASLTKPTNTTLGESLEGFVHPMLSTPWWATPPDLISRV